MSSESLQKRNETPISEGGSSANRGARSAGSPDEINARKLRSPEGNDVNSRG